MLAVTRMIGGFCVAGMTQDPDAVSGLAWVRPVREHGHVLLGDITLPDGTRLEPFDVVEFSLVQQRPDPPHVEDWITDFSRQRPGLVRRLEGERRDGFLRRYLDRAPEEVLQRQERSLCLIKPDWIKGAFRLDSYTGALTARMSFGLGPYRYIGSIPKGGVAITDLKWRAFARAWLPPEGGWADFDEGDLEARYGIQEVYLTIGLTRSHERTYWPIIAGVHTIPDYRAPVDYDNP